MSSSDPRAVFKLQANAISALSELLDDRFLRVVGMIRACEGRIILFGVGKSGIIARKVAATMASVGIPAFFLHAGECQHGDIGSIRSDDLIIAISYGGESNEIVEMLPVIEHIGAALVAITGKPNSTLGRYADTVLDIGEDPGEGVAAWTHLASLAASMAMGDALAVSVAEASGLTKENFGRHHPGGSFGKELSMQSMHRGGRGRV
jgi:arabinose-5-phosphate isomerase